MDHIEIVRIEDLNDPRLDKVLAFLKNYYDKKEEEPSFVDRRDIWEQQLRDSRKKNYAYPISIAAAFEGDNVIAAAVENLLNIRTKKSFGFLAYSAPEEQLDTATPVSRAVRSVEDVVKELAAKKGRELIGYFVESEKGKEHLYGIQGYKILENVEYWEPCQNFDLQTGEKLSKEKHLTPMMRLVGGENSISGIGLQRIIKKIYYDFYCPYPEDVTGVKYRKRAYNKILKYFDALAERSLASFEDRERVRLIEPKHPLPQRWYEVNINGIQFAISFKNARDCSR